MEYNDTREERGQSPLDMGGYLHSMHFLEATMENWQSEFLAMAVMRYFPSFFANAVRPNPSLWRPGHGKQVMRINWLTLLHTHP